MIWLVTSVNGRPPTERVLAGRVISTVSAALRAASSALLHGLGGGIVVCLHLLLEFVDDLPMAGRSSGATVRRFFIRAGILPFLLRYSCQKGASPC